MTVLLNPALACKTEIWLHCFLRFETSDIQWCFLYCISTYLWCMKYWRRYSAHSHSLSISSQQPLELNMRIPGTLQNILFCCIVWDKKTECWQVTSCNYQTFVKYLGDVRVNMEFHLIPTIAVILPLLRQIVKKFPV